MYTLKRSDGLIKRSEDVRWIEFNEDGRGKELHETPKVGLGLIMSPFNIFFTWQTTPVKEIIHTELKDDKLISVKFKTSNSTYELEYVTNPHINENEN